MDRIVTRSLTFYIHRYKITREVFDPNRRGHHGNAPGSLFPCGGRGVMTARSELFYSNGPPRRFPATQRCTNEETEIETVNNS
jgi:hypothetical protein